MRKKKRTKSRSRNISWIVFIDAWQNSTNLEEFLAALNLKYDSCNTNWAQSRAARGRKKGLALKKLKATYKNVGRPTEDWAALARFAAGLVKPEQTQITGWYPPLTEDDFVQAGIDARESVKKTAMESAQGVIDSQDE